MFCIQEVNSTPYCFALSRCPLTLSFSYYQLLLLSLPSRRLLTLSLSLSLSLSLYIYILSIDSLALVALPSSFLAVEPWRYPIVSANPLSLLAVRSHSLFLSLSFALVALSTFTLFLVALSLSSLL